MADPTVDARKELDWDLHINVPTQGVRKSVRVTSDESVGALMIKIAEKLGERCCRLGYSHWDVESDSWLAYSNEGDALVQGASKVRFCGPHRVEHPSVPEVRHNRTDCAVPNTKP